MKVSLVVATYGREQVLCETLAALLEQRYPDYELIVIDQTAVHEPQTEQFLASNRHRLRHHRETRPSLPHARNVGLSLAVGDVVLFVDDDVLPDDEHLITHHVRCYDDPTVGAVAGRVIEPLPPNAPPGVARVNVFGRIVSNFTGERPADVETAKGANMSFRRIAILAAGGFDTRYVGNAILEETDACYGLRTAGWKILYEPRAGLHHRMAQTGGCREASWIEGRYWLYHNSALFYRKRKPRLGLPLFLAFFAARGVVHVLRGRGGARDHLHLMRGLARGLRAYREPQP